MFMISSKKYSFSKNLIVFHREEKAKRFVDSLIEHANYRKECKCEKLKIKCACLKIKDVLDDLVIEKVKFDNSHYFSPIDVLDFFEVKIESMNA
jgi:hypothetical protein